MSALEDAPQIEFQSRVQLRKWLETHHLSAAPFWLVSYKKHVTKHYIPYSEIVEELLCFAWVDSRTRRLDDDRTMLFVSPRKAGSTWSASNKKRVARLIRDQRMHPAGLDSIASAKEDGSWIYLDEIENLVIPDDLKSALAKNARAMRSFEGFNKAAKKVILLWLKSAKRETTRRNRILETVRLAAKGLKAAHPESKGQ
ncbi:MAG: YdeI/OmpD-associated family protein [Pseudomonadota bacterium]